jgi:hypothetical protein
MGRVILIMLIGGGLVWFFVTERDEAAALAGRQIEQQTLLTQIEAVHTPSASTVVDEWRRTYPEPSVERLAELKIMAQRIQNDPSSAEQYTTAASQKRIDAIPFESVIGGKPVAKPGIDG